MPIHERPRLMVVEDDPDTAALIRETLQDYFGPDCVRHCATVAQALAADTDQIDLVLSDMNLPDGTGLEVLEKLLRRRPELPIVLVTGEGILENAVTAIRKGAYDYVVKAGDYLFALPLVVEKNLQIWRTKQENQRLAEQLKRTLEEVRIKNQQLEEAVAKLETVAATDPLTCLANRRAFNQAMDRSFAEATRYGHDLACIMIDLDGFKLLNDSLGHQKGDELLQRAARVLEANCRRSDVAGRYGGDEFILLLPQTDIDTARQVASRIRDEFSAAAQSLARQMTTPTPLTMSIGLSSLHHSRPANPEALVAHADHALYRAKQAGKTCVMVYSAAAPQPAPTR